MKQLSFLFRMSDRASGPALSLLRLFQRLDAAILGAQRHANTFTNRLGMAFVSLRTRARAFLATLGGVRKTLFDLRTLLGGLVLGYGVQQTFSTAIGAAAFKENTLVAFRTLLGSQDAAEQMYRDAVKFASATPFSTEQVISGYQTLLTARFDPAAIPNILAGVGDLAALRGFNPEVIDRVLLAFTQIKNKGKLAGEEMRQLAEAGVPVGLVYEKLGEMLGKTPAEIMKLQEAGKIGANAGLIAVLEALRESVSGGALGGMMAKQADSLNGIISTLRSRPLEFLMDLDTTQGYQSYKGFLMNLRQATDESTAIGRQFKHLVLNTFGTVLETVFGPMEKMTSPLAMAKMLIKARNLSKRFTDWWHSTIPAVIASVKDFGQGFREGYAFVRDLLVGVAGVLPLVTNGLASLGLIQGDVSGSSAQMYGRLAAVGVGLWLVNTLTLGLVGSFLRSLIPALFQVGRAVLVAMGPWGWLAAAVIAAGVLIWQNWDLIKEKGLEVLEWFKTLPTQFRDAATSIGNAISEGLASGIQAVEDKLKGALNWLERNTIGRFQQDVEVYSPSRVMDWTGRMLGLGLAQGITSSRTLIERATTSSFVQPALQPMMSVTPPSPTATVAASGRSEGGGFTIGNITVNVPVGDVKDYDDFEQRFRERFPQFFAAMLEQLAVEGGMA